MLQKLDRLPELTFLKNEDLPKATTLPPDKLYGLIYNRDPALSGNSLPKFLDGETLETLNVQLKRNYLTNFKAPKNLNYVRGNWRILSIRELTTDDFIQQGFAVLAQALEIPAEQENSTNPEYLPYPVELEIILPTAKDVSIPPNTEITTDNSFELRRLPHALAIIHISRTGANDEPISRITTIPLLSSSFPLTKTAEIPLTPPLIINPKGSLPLFSTDDSDDAEAALAE